MFQVTVHADGYISVEGKGLMSGHGGLVAERPLVDPSESVSFDISRSKEDSILKVTGIDPVSGAQTEIFWPQGADNESEICRGWPEEINVRLMATTNSATPITWFTKPIIT